MTRKRLLQLICAGCITGALSACASAGAAGDTAISRRCTDEPQTGSMLPACNRGSTRTSGADEFERARQVGAPIRGPGATPSPR